jgi:hypothetical protein
MIKDSVFQDKYKRFIDARYNWFDFDLSVWSISAASNADDLLQES